MNVYSFQKEKERIWRKFLKWNETILHKSALEMLSKLMQATGPRLSIMQKRTDNSQRKRRERILKWGGTRLLSTALFDNKNSIFIYLFILFVCVCVKFGSMTQAFKTLVDEKITLMWKKRNRRWYSRTKER